MILPIVLGQKYETKRIFTPEGVSIPVTFIKTAPSMITSVSLNEESSQKGITIGYGEKKHIAKNVRGKLIKEGIEKAVAKQKYISQKELKNILVSEGEKKGIKIGEKEFFIGEVINPSDVFNIGDNITVVGTSKGKGFAGVVKRHGFAGGPRTHGQSDRERAPGSIGQRMTPGRVFKGLRMAGRMGTDRVSVKGLSIVQVTETGVYVKGVIPGYKTSFVEIHKA